MVQILPQQKSLGELLGSGLGAGIQTGLAQKLKQHAQEQQQQKTAQSLGPLLGLSEEETQQLGGLPMEFQQLLAKRQTQAAAPISQYQQLQTALREKELEQKAEKEEERKKEWEYTQHKDFRKEVTDNYKDSVETEMRLNRMKELNDKGTLTGPATAVLMDRLGLPISVLGNPDSEEFDKLSKDMLKNIRTYFGARINVVEVENFLKTIPSLMNSEEGRDRIINNLKLLLEPRKLMFQEYRKIRQEGVESGRGLPIDLQETVLENISPQLDDLSKRFEMGPSQELGPQIAPETREFQKMPAAKDYAGAVIEDDKGNRYKSDGKTWRKV